MSDANQLVGVIEDLIQEIEEMKKSERFSAAKHSYSADEAKANGDMEKAEECEEKEDKEEEKKEDKEEEKKEEVEKAEKEEDEDKKEDEEDEIEKAEKEMEMAKAEYEAKEKLYKDKLKQVLQVAKPNWEANKGKLLSPEQSKRLSDIKSAKAKGMEKSEKNKEVEELSKAVKFLADEVKSLKSAPLTQKGTNIQNVKPLQKSAQEPESLSKTQVLKGLEELAKTGVDVVDDAIRLSSDLVSPEQIAKKYKF